MSSGSEEKAITLRERIRYIVKSSGLSKAEFAKQVGVSAAYITNITSKNNNAKPSISDTLAILIALRFGFSEEWVKHGSGTPRPDGYASEADLQQKNETEDTLCLASREAYEVYMRLNALTKKELQTVQLQLSFLPLSEMLLKLGISNNGLKWRNKQIYRKLEVQSKRQMLSLLRPFTDKILNMDL